MSDWMITLQVPYAENEQQFLAQTVAVAIKTYRAATGSDQAQTGRTRGQFSASEAVERSNLFPLEQSCRGQPRTDGEE